MPPTGGWANAGMVRGGKTDLCWRLMDAQYWGKPRLVQREERESSLWQILEDSVPQKYYLSPVICSRFLRLAQTTGCPPPEPVEYLLIKQGKIPIIRPFQERRMRSAAKSGNQSAFLASFGRPDEPFPTLLAKAVKV